MTEAPPAPGQCPVSNTPGHSVRRVTLKALLRPDALRRLDGSDYRYCPAADCDVVYFNSAAGSVFRKPDLSVRVGQKEADDPVPVCYCFGYTVEDLRRDAAAPGGPRIRHVVESEVRAGHCACEVKNPKGSCCLVDISFAMRRLDEARSIIETSREDLCRTEQRASPPSRSSGPSTSASTASPAPAPCTSSARAWG